MAYQPKSYKKFVATAATATLVASAIVPVASANGASTAAFTDVSDKYKEAVDYLVTNNITVGLTETSFGVDSTIKRGDAAIMLAKALGIVEDEEAEESGFSDVPARATLAINSLKAAGIISGKTATKFGFEDNLTRGEVALIMANVKAYDLKGDASKLKFTDVSSRYASAVAGFVEAGITSGKTATTFGTGDAIKRGDFAIFVYKAEQLEEVVGFPAVTSVKSTNLQEIVVEFSAPVTDAGNATFTVTQSGATTADSSDFEFAEDGKSVTITMDSPLQNNEYYVVEMSGVVEEDTFEPLAPYATTIKVADTTAPSILSVKAVTKDTETNTFSITFSEPAFFDLIKVDGELVSANAVPNTNNQKYTVTTSEDLEVGTLYEVSVDGLRDLAGNYATGTQKASLSITRDDVKPTFALEGVNPKQFKVVFNEEVNAATQALDSIVVKNEDGNILTQANKAVQLSDGKSFLVTLVNSPIASDETSAVVDVTVKGIQDVAGNTVTTDTKEVTLVKEVVKPTISAARVLPGTNNQVEVTFSEKVSGISAGDFRLLDPNSTPLTISAVSDSTTGVNNKVILTLAAALPANGEYNLALVVGSVTDTSGNTNAAKALKFSYNNVVAPALSAVITDNFDADASPDTASVQSDRKVLVDFNQDLVTGLSASTGDYKVGAADNVANYTLNGSSLPAGTVLTHNSTDDSILIDFSSVAASALPTALKEGGNIVIGVSNVKSTAGATVQYTSKSLVVADLTKPRLTSAFLQGNATSGYTLTVQYSEKIDSASNTDLVLQDVDGGTAVLTTAQVSADATKVVYNLTLGNSVITKAYKLHAPSPTITDDLNGNVLEAVSPTDAISVVNYGNN